MINNIFFQNEYIKSFNEVSDINEHICYLYSLALECNSITEFGVRGGISTRAFLYSGVKLRSYDIEIIESVKDLFNKAQEIGIDAKCIQADDTKIDIEKTDMLFIDSAHFYGQLKKELFLHHKNVNKYIVFHDTQTFGTIGDNNMLGILPAIIDFIIENDEWKLKKCFTNNNGLIVIERR